MLNPIAVILRFDGDRDDLLGRFEQARKSWIDAQGDGYNPPAFFAVCEAENGIVVISGWETEEDLSRTGFDEDRFSWIARTHQSA